MFMPRLFAIPSPACVRTKIFLFGMFAVSYDDDHNADGPFMNRLIRDARHSIAIGCLWLTWPLHRSVDWYIWWGQAIWS
jgi:hypothetical protein